MNRRPGAPPLITPESRVPRRRAAGWHTSLIDDAADLPDPLTQSTRVRIRGEAGPNAWPPDASMGADQPPGSTDTVVLGDLGLFGGPSPKHQNPARLIVAAAGLAVVAFAGFVGVPALLHTLGVGGSA